MVHCTVLNALAETLFFESNVFNEKWGLRVSGASETGFSYRSGLLSCTNPKSLKTGRALDRARAA